LEKHNIKYTVETTEKAEREFFETMPKTLYKYRNWKNENHKKILTEFELFFPNPSRFNDPYDCGLPFRQDPNDLEVENIKRKLEEIAPKKFPQWAKNKIKLEEECAKQLILIMQNPSEYFQINYGYRAEDLNQMYGVFSLTPHPFNFLMWSHYSDSHSGFVVGFNTEKLVKKAFGQFKKVDYKDEIPVISILDDDKGLMNKLIYTKSKEWEYEDEYRITKILLPDTKLYFAPDMIQTVYLGNKMDFNHKLEIVEIVKENFSHAYVFEMDLHSEKFALISRRIF
jgi:Protein of unknown function (DUF2971)